MAGLGFKDFQVGEVLTSADVDGYLMQQSVMRFADSGARGSALGTAAGTGVALAEGMVSYLDDSNQIQVYSGSGWTSPVPGIGSNVVQTVKTDTFSTSLAAGGTATITGLSVAITPTLASSKVLIALSTSVSWSAANNGGMGLIVKRDGTAIGVGDAAGNRTRTTTHGTDFAANSNHNSVSVVLLDSPATTSEVVYTVDVMSSYTVTGTFYLNRSGDDGDTADHQRGASRIIAVEVAA